MHGNINIAGKQRAFDPCCEQSFSSRAKIDHLGRVTFGGNNLGLDLRIWSRRANRFLNQPGLRARKLAAARTEYDPQDFGAHSAATIPTCAANYRPRRDAQKVARPDSTRAK